MTNKENNKSKGYGFIEFSNFKEYQSAINNNEPIILGKKKLVFNSAKNRYDSMRNISNIRENKENTNMFNNLGLSNINNSQYYCEYKNEYLNKNLAYQGEKNNLKQNEYLTLKNEDIKNEPLDIQIKYALQNMANDYSRINPSFLKLNIYNYYCGPFLKREVLDNNKELLFKYNSSSF